MWLRGPAQIGEDLVDAGSSSGKKVRGRPKTECKRGEDSARWKALAARHIASNSLGLNKNIHQILIDTRVKLAVCSAASCSSRLRMYSHNALTTGIRSVTRQRNIVSSLLRQTRRHLHVSGWLIGGIAAYA